MSIKEVRPPIPFPVRKGKNWFVFLARLHKNTTLFTMLFSTLLVGVYSGVVWYLFEYVIHENFRLNMSVHTILGTTLGLLLVIRSNTAYERWWEGRRLVGGLVNNTRNLALKLSAILDPNDEPVRRKLATLISNYVFALKEHLRKGVIYQQLEGFSDQVILLLKASYHVPNRICTLLMEEINTLYRLRQLNDMQMILLDKQLEALTDLTGGCERIKKSPLPLAYAMHLKLFILVFVLTLPFSLSHDFDFLTIPAVMLIFYAMAGMELIGEEIEDPFGNDENDIPMDDICATIRSNVFEILLLNQAGRDPELFNKN